MKRAEYRKFRIRGSRIEGRGSKRPENPETDPRSSNVEPRFLDDFASMHEVVLRRYRKVLENGGPFPDLILIDGGKGQLSAAYAALESLGLANLVAVGIAKKEELLFTREHVEPMALASNSPALLLIQRIRDEAHRFAITFHRQSRAKRDLRSALDDVAGDRAAAAQGAAHRVRQPGRRAAGDARGSDCRGRREIRRPGARVFCRAAVKRYGESRMIKEYRALARPYVVTDGKRFKLSDHNPRGPGKNAAHRTRKFLKKGIEVLSGLQETLYAQDRWGVLLIFQAMDAAGKDSAIKHVMSGDRSEGLPGLFVQGALVGGARPRLSVAHVQGAAGARADRHLQPLVLRGNADRPRPPHHPQPPETAARGDHARTSGRSASRTSTRSSATWRGTASSSASSS